MPQPTSQQVHIDAVLSNISVAYLQSRANFVAGRAFPIVPVEKQSDKFFVFNKNDFFRDEAQLRADAQESAGSGYGLSTGSYLCDVWAMHKDIGSQARANADSGIDLDRGATEFVTQRMLVRREVQWAADFFVPNVWGTTATPAVLWSNIVTSDPIGDIETAKRAILSVTGLGGNKLIVGYDVMFALKHHPDVVDRFKYTSSESVTEQMVAKVLGVDEILVCQAIYATNKEGAADVYAFVQQSKSALLVHTTSAPGLLTPSAGYIFSWRGVSQGMGLDIGTSKFYIPERKCDRIESEIAFDDKIVSADLGYFFQNAVA